MALTGASAANSSLYIRQTSKTALRDSLAVEEMSAKKRIAKISHTIVAGDGAGTVIGDADEMNLCLLPAGAVIDYRAPTAADGPALAAMARASFAATFADKIDAAEMKVFKEQTRL